VIHVDHESSLEDAIQLAQERARAAASAAALACADMQASIQHLQHLQEQQRRQQQGLPISQPLQPIQQRRLSFESARANNSDSSLEQGAPQQPPAQPDQMPDVGGVQVALQSHPLLFIQFFAALMPKSDAYCTYAAVSAANRRTCPRAAPVHNQGSRPSILCKAIF
jgi:hypothetical protein